MRKTLITCIGNELVADDAAGFVAFEELQGVPARLEYLSVGGIDLLPHLDAELEELIVVDAVQLGAPVGTLHIIPWDELPQSSTQISAHGLGLRETIDIGKILYPGLVPASIILVGIEGNCFNRTREHMAKEVASAAREAAVWIRQRLAGRSAQSDTQRVQQNASCAPAV